MLHQIISPEKVPLVYRVAGLGSRFLAWLIDLAIILGLILGAVQVSQPWESIRDGLGFGVFLVLGLVIEWGYFILFEWLWHGQTPGKRVIGIRVIDLDGAGISLGQAAVRNILRVADGLPLLIPDFMPVMYGVGFLVAACDPQQRRLGDLAAGTLLVYAEAETAPVLALRQGFSVHAARTKSLRQRLEQLTRPQKDTLVDLCLRRDQLRVRERVRLFTVVADNFRRKLGLLPEEHQSDERFVLQLAAALIADDDPQAPSFRKRGGGTS